LNTATQGIALPDVSTQMATACTMAGASRFVTLCRTEEPHQAESFLKDLWNKRGGVDAKFQFGSKMDMEFKGFEFAGLTAAALRYGTSASTQTKRVAPAGENLLIFSYSVSGHSSSKSRGLETSSGDAIMFADGQENNDFSMAADSKSLSLVVPRKDMAAAKRALDGPQGADDLDFSPMAARGTGASAALLRVINRLAETPHYPQRNLERLERSLKEAVLFELLLAWPGTTQLNKPAEPALPASTRLARDFIHSHIGELPTVGDVAASCRIGVRALDRGFKKYLGVSPLQYMMELRLQAVHDDLVASRHGSTVTEVASYWGFSNLGIFAARYREQFGELPSETLRKKLYLGQRTTPKVALSG
jgi:AraC-like DNA-binding protein